MVFHAILTVLAEMLNCKLQLTRADGIRHLFVLSDLFQNQVPNRIIIKHD
jgi:hypothetical protein